VAHNGKAGPYLALPFSIFSKYLKRIFNDPFFYLVILFIIFNLVYKREILPSHRMAFPTCRLALLSDARFTRYGAP
jgi:hypothetical protein